MAPSSPRLALVAAVLTLAPMALAQNPCASPGAGIIAWWEGAGGPGNRTTDLVGMTDATLEGGARVDSITNLSPRAYSFDGVNAHLASVGEIEGLDGDNVTIEGWLRTRGGTPSFRGIVSKLDPISERAGDFALLQTPDNRLRFRYRTNRSNGNTELISQTAPVLNAFTPTHFAVRIENGNGFSIFVDGVEVSIASTSASIGALPSGGSDRRTFVGCLVPGARHFFGQLADLTFYNRQLSDDEIAAVAQAGESLKCKQAAPLPNGIAHWYDGEVCREHAVDRVGLEAAPLEPRVGADVTITDGIVGAGFDTNSGGGLNTQRPLLRTTGPFTVEMWVFRRRFAEEVLYSELNTAGLVAGEFSLRFADNSIRLVRATGLGNQAEGASGTFPIPFNVWTHVAAVFAGPGDLRIFVNGQRGERLTGLTTTSNFSTADGGFGVGGSGFTFLRAAMDECTLYRSAVSDAEIEAIYRAGRFGKQSQTTRALDCRSGSTEDLTLDVTLSQGQILAPPSLQLSGGDSFFLELNSPAGTFNRNPYGILVQAYGAASPPSGIPGVPEFAIDFGSAFFVAGGLTPTPFGLPLLNPNGAQVTLDVPQALAGTRIRMQGFAISPTASNGSFAATDPIDLQIRSAVTGPGI